MRREIVVVICLWLAALRPASATTQLIVNGAFNSTSAAPWVLSGTGPVVGAGYLSMGNASGQIEKAYQTVTFPTNLIAATLTLNYGTVSTDPNQDDTLTIYLADANLNPLVEIYATTSATTSTTYSGLSNNVITYPGGDLVSSFAGETVNLLFYVTTDPTYGIDTSFYITDVSLVAATTSDIPANDDFTNATLIPPAGITNRVTTTYASKEFGEPNIGNNGGGHSVWWTWTAPSIGTVNIATTGSSFNTLLGVYTGSSVSDLTVVTNNDGLARPSGLAFLTFAVSPGTQYHIGLDGYNGQSGNAVFIFKFIKDTTPPIVRITSPLNGADVANSSVLVTGTASDNVAVASVYFQLENANGSNAWQLAAGTTTWSAMVTNLIPGTNKVMVRAYDMSTNASKPVSCVLNYLIPIPLSLTIIGEGTVSGATNGKLLDLNYPYALTAIAAAGSHFQGWTGDLSTNNATLRFIMASNLSVTATFLDVQKPTLSITAPKAGQRWSNSVFNVTGKASDNVGVANVWLQINSEGWTTNVMSNNRWTNWNEDVTLNPGTNTIKAYSVDAAGNTSPTNSVSFIYILSAPLTVQTNGRGAIKPNYNNTLLEISNRYSMTAMAGSGYVFSNWTAAGGGVLTNGPTLKFTMVSNLDFTANFVPNPFTPATGTYEGLFFDTNQVAQASSGFFKALVNPSGSFTASFQQGSRSYPVSGQFSLTGGWSTNALRAWGGTAISLQLDLTGGNGIEGGLTNAGWVAELGADRAIFSTGNPAPQAGKYTLVVPGTNSTGLPGGNGFGAVTVSAGGSVTLSASLGDGAAVTPTANVSERGDWPLYLSLYGGNGILFGWLTFTNEADRDIDGILHWFKPAQPASPLYKAGFTNEIEAAGSAYRFASGERVLDVTNGYVLLDDGGLAQSISNQFTLAPNNIVTGSNKLHVTITPTTGLFTGTATNAQGKTVSFSGAVFQKQTNGFGLFLNSQQSGSVLLAPQ